MTEAELREATGLGQEWRLMWRGADLRAKVRHCCPIAAPGGTAKTAEREMGYEDTGAFGIQVAKCERCCTAWVRMATA